MELDEALSFLGAYGRYQLLVYFIISLFDNFPSIWHMSVMAFTGYEPKHHCKVPEGADYNQTIVKTYEDGAWRTDKCLMHPFVNGSYLNSTTKCSEGWYYDPDPIKTSVVTQWDLVCDKNVLAETSLMVFNFGVMFGAILFGFLSDRYGRKKIFIFALLAQSVIGSATAFSPTFIVYMILRFFVGALEQGVNITGYIMATELFPPKQRTVMGVSHEFLWALGGACVPLMGYFLRDWRHLQLAVSLPSALAIICWWLVPESVVWLLVKGRVKEAEAILERAAKVNNKNLPENCLSDHESKPILNEVGESKPKEKVYTIIDLFRTPNLRKISICTSGLWALNTMVYYGLSYNTPNLYGNMYFNFFLGQMVEIPSVALTLWLVYRVGRRWPLCLSHVFCGVVCIVSPWIPPQTAGGWDLTWASVTLALLGKFSINCSFTIIYIYGPEIYPTVLRNTGSGLGSFSGRFGGILFPYINYISKLDTPVAKKMPLVIFGILSMIGGFLALPLPETRHRPLPDTIEDVENYEEFCKRHTQHCHRQNTMELTRIGDEPNGAAKV